MNYLADLPYPKSIYDLVARLTGWLVLLTCFGYPIQVLMVLIVGGDSTPVNLSFRLAYLVISVYLLGYGLFRSPILKELKRSLSGVYINAMASVKLSTASQLIPWISLFLFWFIYTIRLAYDLEYKEWHFQGYNNLYVYAWAFGCTLIPALTILLNIKNIEAKRISWYILIFTFLATAIIALILLYLSGSDLRAIIEERSAIVLTGEVKLKGKHLLNGITMSFYGALTILTALTWFVFLQQKLSLFRTIFFVICCLLGLFILVAGASRGPMMGLIVISSGILIISIISYFGKLIKYTKARLHRTNVQNELISGRQFLYKPIMTLLAVMMLFTVFNLAVKRYHINLKDIAFSKRLSALLSENKDKNTTFRIDAWKSAWHQFTVNPIFGDSIINDVGYFYSHNIFMDALMSVGIVGTIPFLVWFFLSFWYFMRLPAHRKRELSVLFVTYLAALLLSMTSGGIFTVPEVWILSAAVIGLSQKYLLDEGGTSGQVDRRTSGQVDRRTSGPVDQRTSFLNSDTLKR